MNKYTLKVVGGAHFPLPGQCFTVIKGKTVDGALLKEGITKGMTFFTTDESLQRRLPNRFEQISVNPAETADLGPVATPKQAELARDGAPLEEILNAEAAKPATVAEKAGKAPEQAPTTASASSLAAAEAKAKEAGLTLTSKNIKNKGTRYFVCDPDSKTPSKPLNEKSLDISEVAEFITNYIKG